tara:strand:+ start:1225 stop:1626 length:402 start_codon:yes stop_codon:yes gene_type:complete
MKISDIELPSNRKFGLFFAAVFVLAFIYLLKVGAHSIGCIFGALAIIFFCVALTKSELLLPLNKFWMCFGLILGAVVSPIVLGMIFFILFTPIGMLMRLFGRDELRLKSGSAASYWKTRNPSGPTADSFKNQY